jgi:hypothetical protein
MRSLTTLAKTIECPIYCVHAFRGCNMFNYYEKADEFLGWSLVSLIAGQHDKFDELSKKTDGWKKVDLKISINGVEVDSSHFMESVESNMKYWSGQKAAESVEHVMDNVREKIDKIDDMLVEVSDFVKRKLEDELGIKFPEH